MNCDFIYCVSKVEIILFPSHRIYTLTILQNTKMSKTFLDADMDAELEEMEKDNQLSEDSDKEGRNLDILIRKRLLFQLKHFLCR